MITPYTAVCHLHARYQGSGPVYLFIFNARYTNIRLLSQSNILNPNIFSLCLPTIIERMPNPT